METSRKFRTFTVFVYDEITRIEIGRYAFGIDLHSRVEWRADQKAMAKAIEAAKRDFGQACIRRKAEQLHLTFSQVSDVLEAFSAEPTKYCVFEATKEPWAIPSGLTSDATWWLKWLG